MLCLMMKQQIIMSSVERRKIIDDFKKQQKDLEKLYEEIIRNLRINKKEKPKKTK